MPEFGVGFGAFCFGAVIGWFIYFTNRYRTGNIQVSDVVALVGAIGGAGITALFIPKDAPAQGPGLIGAYGIGLAFGFFAYFAVLVLIVQRSGGAYNMLWFLDGRRKRLALQPDWEIPTEVAQRPMALRPGAAASVPAPASRAIPTTEVSLQKDAAITSLNQTLDSLQDRLGNTTDPSAVEQLLEAQRKLFGQRNELVAIRIREIFDREEHKAALTSLAASTAALGTEAAHLKDATNAVRTATKIIEQATKVLTLLAVFA